MQPSFVTPPVPARPRSFGALLGDALRRPGGRRGVSVLSLVLFLAGVAMFAYPVGTDFYSRYQQDRLQGTFSDPGVQQAYLERKVDVGDGLTLLRIPKLDVKVLVVEGTTPSALRAGAGHYVGTPLPGEAGNVGIAGHRTTFGRPFNRLAELGPGDIVTLETPFATYTYKGVPAFLGHDNPWVVKPSDFSVVSQGTGHLLTLTTCHPKGSAKQRLVMRFTLVKTDLKPGGSK
ncbi:MAG: class E sortase [Actinobacteria bacterium]|nr:class E sortase [Actinomycetota bacterium]MCA1721015.1 class E sortase [Actinomycetota bacterium]